MAIDVPVQEYLRFPGASSRRQVPPRLTSKQRDTLMDLQQVWRRLTLHLLGTNRLVAPWSLGVSSSIGGEGKTTTSIGLAMSLAEETDREVALVETSIQQPNLARDFSIEPTPGLFDYLADKCRLDATFRPTSRNNLTVLPAGEPLQTHWPSSADTFTVQIRRKLPDILPQLQNLFEYVVLDLPSILQDTNTVEMTKSLDGLLLVVRAGVTPLDKVREAAQLLEAGKMLGVVHIGPPSAIPGWLLHLIEE